MLNAFPIPAFQDNYIWCLHSEGTESAVVVDPGQARPVMEALDRRGWRLAAILITHHHNDHIGGVRELLRRWPDITVYGPRDPRIPLVNRAVGEGDSVELTELGVHFQVWDVPGHTSTHIAFYGEGMLFCGDTLFASGCGRVFDGTHEQLAASLERIAKLPEETEVYCAHEYTLDNLGFARWVEPGSPAVIEREAKDKGSQAQNRPTVPSRLGLELATNPFMRTEVAEVRAAAEKYAGRKLHSTAEVFTAIRQWKDREYD